MLSMSALLQLLGRPRDPENLDAVLRELLSELLVRRGADAPPTSRDREVLQFALKDVRAYFDSHCTGFGSDCDLPHTSFEVLERMLTTIAARAVAVEEPSVWDTLDALRDAGATRLNRIPPETADGH